MPRRCAVLLPHAVQQLGEIDAESLRDLDERRQPWVNLAAFNSRVHGRLHPGRMSSIILGQLGRIASGADVGGEYGEIHGRPPCVTIRPLSTTNKSCTLLRMSETPRVMIDIETEGSSGVRRMRLDLPRGDFTLEELHELARGAAESANVLMDESTAVSIRVNLPEG